MKLAVLADIHGNYSALKAIMEDMPSVDALIAAGDIVGYYPFFEECVAALKEAGFISIRGNHEAFLAGLIDYENDFFKWYRKLFDNEASAGTRVWLENLPFSLSMDIPHGLLKVYHGSPRSVREYIYEDDAPHYPFYRFEGDIIVLGHTHLSMDMVVGDKRVINPGAAGQPRRGIKGASYLLYNSSEPDPFEIRNVNYDSSELVTALHDMDYEQRFIAPFMD